MKIRLLPEAERDLEIGADFYESQRPGLGSYFNDCLTADIESLRIYAGIHETYRGFHRSLAKRFRFQYPTCSTVISSTSTLFSMHGKIPKLSILRVHKNHEPYFL
ncbi:MAG: hypothetical protein ACKN82_12970, partial [Pirellula sp.]